MHLCAERRGPSPGRDGAGLDPRLERQERGGEAHLLRLSFGIEMTRVTRYGGSTYVERNSHVDCNKPYVYIFNHIWHIYIYIHILDHSYHICIYIWPNIHIYIYIWPNIYIYIYIYDLIYIYTIYTYIYIHSIHLRMALSWTIIFNCIFKLNVSSPVVLQPKPMVIGWWGWTTIS